MAQEQPVRGGNLSLDALEAILFISFTHLFYFGFAECISLPAFQETLAGCAKRMRSGHLVKAPPF